MVGRDWGDVYPVRNVILRQKRIFPKRSPCLAIDRLFVLGEEEGGVRVGYIQLSQGENLKIGIPVLQISI